MPLPEIEAQLLGHPAHSLVAIPTELSRLLKCYRSAENGKKLHLQKGSDGESMRECCYNLRSHSLTTTILK
jgi:hypothetical protein